MTTPLVAAHDQAIATFDRGRAKPWSLDLAFVRDLVRDSDAEIGRPTIDPVVVFKVLLILFFAGQRSERQLMRVVADRLSLRWSPGDDLTEVLPDHSSLTRIRERYEVSIFRRFFEAVVERGIAAGIGVGERAGHRLDRCRGHCGDRLAAPTVCRGGAPCPTVASWCFLPSVARHPFFNTQGRW